MDIYTAVRLHLLSYPGVEPLTGQRIYWRKKPENIDKTCISFFRVTHNKNSLINKYTDRFQFDVWSPSGSEAKQLAALVEKAFDKYKGVMSGEKPIKQGAYENMTDMHEKDTGIYHIPVDVFFHYLEN